MRRVFGRLDGLVVRLYVLVVEVIAGLLLLLLLLLTAPDAQATGDGVERRRRTGTSPAGLRLVLMMMMLGCPVVATAAGRVAAAALARHRRDLLRRQPELFDDPRVADDHEQERQDQHDKQLVEGDDEAAVRAEALLLARVYRVHAI